ncbi:hypothetical protein M2347_000028 [Chryseobacterium sp. H1D6B]|uniref:hypothetical protein n=1 Tax=Chryseobacterium sp. H1D6B TaxID=2940588 RepID=UPI0015CDE287|nr:hypothetical protein [Chryseobacterium sp. H1D6B]MDH6250301.1 hypothetical protein [Chryseobacterium sp. H1D6B]
MTIDTIYQAIKQWKTLADSYKNGNKDSESEILDYLNQGSHFSVSGEEIKQWKVNLENEETKTIHAYVGINEDKLKFFLIDSKSDADADFDDIAIKEFTRRAPDGIIQNESDLTNNPPISSESAIYRNFRWDMYCSSWLETQKTEPFFQLVSIPFYDYERLHLEDGESCTCFFGLTNETDAASPIFDYHIEIITVKNLSIDEISKIAEDYSTPRPPFTVDTIQDYQLLLKSDAYL